MAKKISNEIKTGVAVLAAVLLLVGVLIKTGDLSVAKKGYPITTEFLRIGGVKQFAPVRLAGLEVGEVRGLRMRYDSDRTVIEADLWIEDGVRIRKDAKATVANLGLMGEKYIEIKSGQSPEFVESGGAIEAVEPVGMDELIEKAEGVMDEVTLALGDFRKLAGHADEVIVDAKPKLSNILTNLDGILSKNRSKLDAIMENLRVTSAYFMEFSEDVKYHPWKVLAKGKEKTPQEITQLRDQRRADGLPTVPDVYPTEEEEQSVPSKGKNRGFLSS
ncbi:MAG: MCE family protein [Candidatus Omnitrophica bacterium]|nr:MCE family protein [Candidatus Omnitrophota bacterium]